MIDARSREIRLWWPLPLAVFVWLMILWAFGIFLQSPQVEIATPPPIDARFVELPESITEQKASPPSSPPPPPSPPPSPPSLAKSPPISPQTKPRVKPRSVETAKPVKPLLEKEIARTQPPPVVSPTPKAEAPTDLTDYINQARARRGEAGIFDAPKAAVRDPQPQPSEDEISMARIQRNLQTPGVSGVFQIIRIGSRTAEFSFRGWTTGASSRPRLELIEVDAGPNGDVERAVVRRMIQLIRQYHQGNFNWESHRLGRVISLSARPEDSAGLEDFLMIEFFSDYYDRYRR